MQVAVKKTTEILHEHSIGTEERTNAKTSNVDKMTGKQLFSNHFEYQTSGAGILRTRNCCVGEDGCSCRQHWRWQRDDGLRSRPAKKRAAGADLACGGSCACAARASGRWKRQLGLREAKHQLLFETPRVIAACPRTTRMNTRSFQSSLAVGWQSSMTSGQAS